MLASPLRILWLIAVLVVGAGLVATIATITSRLVTDDATAQQPASLVRLADMARDVSPLVGSLERYRRDKGTYPAKPSDLDNRMPADVLADIADGGISFDIGGGAIWVYTRDDDGKGYSLERHFGDGASLTLNVDADGRGWEYAASDDEDAKPVALDP